MKTYGLIQFRISSLLFMYPRPKALNSFIILQSKSLTHTYLRRVKGVQEGVPMYSTHSQGTVHSDDFVPGQSTTGTRSGGGWLHQRTGADFSENRKISFLMHIEPRIVQPKGIDKSDSGVSDFEWIFKSESSAMLSTFVALCALL